MQSFAASKSETEIGQMGLSTSKNSLHSLCLHCRVKMMKLGYEMINHVSWCCRSKLSSHCLSLHTRTTVIWIICQSFICKIVYGKGQSFILSPEVIPPQGWSNYSDRPLPSTQCSNPQLFLLQQSLLISHSSLIRLVISQIPVYLGYMAKVMFHGTPCNRH